MLDLCDPAFQQQFAALEAHVRGVFGMNPEHAAAGVVDLARERTALLYPDRLTYGASVPKIGILLAWFVVHPEAVRELDEQTRHELGLMIKVSSNEMAARYSRLLGLKRIQEILCAIGFYDASQGGGLWLGKHYGETGERYGDPLADHSHAATVRQCLRFYLLLEQGKLVSAEASRCMRRIFESPSIPHEQDKFLKGLAGRNLEIIRKSGSWENWQHDTAVVRGPGRHYILAALTEHPSGNDYLAELARSVDQLLSVTESDDKRRDS